MFPKLLLERSKIQCLLQFPACLGKGQQVEETDDNLVCLTVPLVDNALNLYCHNLGVLAVGGADVLPPWLNLCCFSHSLPDGICVAVHKAHDAVVILGVLVADTSALHHSELVKAELHCLHSLTIDGGRED